MKKHPELTIQRLEKFRDRIEDQYYTDLVPLNAVYHKTQEPISFQDALKATYTSIWPGTRWGDLYECAWFIFSGKTQPEHEGKEVVALIDVGGEACVFDEAGNPIQGLTNKRVEWTMKESIIKKRVPLFKSAKAGEDIRIMADAGANNILGVENVLTYTSMVDGVFNQAALAVYDRDAWHLFIEFEMLLNLMLELDPKGRHRNRLLFTLNEVVNAYGRGTKEEVKACREILAPQLLKKAHASAIKVSAIGHAHIDIAWLWPLRETVRKAARTFSTALMLMKEYPDYKFGASQPHLYQMIKDAYPGLYKRIVQAVKERKWECQGAMWVEADCNLISGESMVRQILYGKKFFLEEFDQEVKNLWLPDVFGYSAALPQILIKSDVPYFMSQKISWNQFNKFPHNTFIWRGIDGTEVFSHFLAPNNYRSDCSSKDLFNLEHENMDIDRTEHALFLYGAGDGGGGPSRFYVEKLRRAADLEDLPKVTMEFAEEYFEKASVSSRDLQVWDGELYLELHRGTLTTQALTKKLNRKLELLFREVEMAYAFHDLENYPLADLDRLWKILLLNQFHDIIPGTSVERVHKESLEQLKDTYEELLQLLQKADQQMVASVTNEGLDNGFLILNSLNWQRTDPVIVLGKSPASGWVDTNGQPLVSQAIEYEGKEATLLKANTPSMGHLVVGMASEEVPAPASSLVVDEKLLENSLLHITFNEDGQIASIFDKEAEREVLDGKPANHFKLYEDRPNLWDAWDIDIFYLETPPTSPKLVSSEVIEKGPLRAGIRFRLEDANYTIDQDVYLYEGSRRIEFHTTVDWRETYQMLRVDFPLNVVAKRAAFEIQYGHVKRPTHNNTSWDMAQFEVVGHKWVDISQPNYGVALLNDCKYGHRIKDNIISLTLLRSPINPDRQADKHVHQFKYALFPHFHGLIRGKVVQEAYQFNIPLRALPIPKQKANVPAKWSHVVINKDHVIVEAVKKAEYSDDLILRMYETVGIDSKIEITLDFDFEEVWLVNLMERNIHQLNSHDRTIELFFKPFEIHTVKVVLKESL